MAETYRIVRSYYVSGGRRRMQGGLTLEEAQAHCRREDTHSSLRVCYLHRGVGPAERCPTCGAKTARAWLDGYEEEK